MKDKKESDNKEPFISSDFKWQKNVKGLGKSNDDSEMLEWPRFRLFCFSRCWWLEKTCQMENWFDQK